MSQDITVPDIGDFDKVEIIELLVAEGDTVAAEDPLIVLESDKAAMEVPSPVAGRLTAIKVKLGDKVGQGDLIAQIEVADDAAAPGDEADDGAAETPGSEAKEAGAEQSPASEVVKETPEAGQEAARQPARAEASPASGKTAGAGPRPAPAAAPPAFDSADDQALPHASPAIRRFARELGVDLREVRGTGPKERIQREDVAAHVKARLAGDTGGAGIPPVPAVDFSAFGDIEYEELPRIRRLSAQNLHRSWLNVPHVTQQDAADITDLEAFRRAENERGEHKLTVLPFLLKTVAVALRRYPHFASSLAPGGEQLILKRYCHLGFAADTPHGLVVPVIRDVDRKSIGELAQEAAELAAAARERKLKPEQMQGACFTISSLGGIGGRHFTPIVNAPEVAILGVSRARQEPVWDGQAFVPRLMLPLSLSYDHRVIDGAAAARFTTHLAELLADLRRLSL